MIAPDDRTVVFRLSYPYAPFAQQLTLGIVPRKAFDGVDVNNAPFNTAPVGTGHYTVVQWRKGDRMVLKANENYWGGAPAIKTVTVVFVEDDNARANRMAAASSTVPCCRRSWPRPTAPGMATGWCGTRRPIAAGWVFPPNCRSPWTPRCGWRSTSASTARR